MENIQCVYCDSLITKQNLSRHQKSELCSRIQKIIQKKEHIYNIEIDKHKNNNKLLNEQINQIKEECNQYKYKITTLEIQLKDALDKAEEYRKIVEKTANKTTVKNYNHNNYLNYISTEPLKLSEISKQVKQIVNCETMMLDDSEFHDHIVDNLLKDENGKDKVLCTDINRKNFSYKDEKSGELICDPELERLRLQLKKGADVKHLKRDLLNILVQEYEDNGSVGEDPYKKFYDILLKIDFGTPFIEHVAKKTYVKTKSTDNNED